MLCLQWNGQTSNKDERYKAVQYLQGIKSDRGGKPQVETLGKVLLAFNCRQSKNDCDIV